MSKTDFDKLQEKVGIWGKATFPHSTRNTIIEHLRREVDELELSQSNRTDAEEVADCMLLLLHLAHRVGFSAETEIRRKFAICQAREWGEPDSQGVVEHVRAEGEAKS